jgi:hypothetical protein|tara:strand:- start:56 stop:580 length:525 start_codon:yes stop_codon:yes gene_type:complete
MEIIRQKYYKDNPETKRKYNKTRRTVVCSDGVKRQVVPSHPDFPGHDPNNVKFLKSVDPLIQRLREEDKKLYEVSDNKQTKLTPGFVYVISHPLMSPWIKVGHSRDPDRRLSSYNTGCPKRGYKLEGYQYFENRKVVEGYIHLRLDQEGFPRKSEWFNCPSQHVLDILGEISYD